jgi:hypothetical protein
VPGPDAFLFLAASAPLAWPPAGVLAYGPGPEVELIPYFFSLLTWAGLSVVAVLLWPLNALLRRFRKSRGAPPVEAKGGPSAPPASVAESPPAAPPEGDRARV